MWKTIVLCASLFGSAALGLLAAARWVEPAVVPAAAAMALCLVGVVLILLAPGGVEEPAAVDDEARPLTEPVRSRFRRTAPRLRAIGDAKAIASPMTAATGPQPTLH